MGGACAEIFAKENPGLTAYIWTFGAPKGMNRKNADEIKAKHFRFTNRADIVTFLPPYWRRGKKAVIIILPNQGHAYRRYEKYIDETKEDLKRGI
jgi:hypothetical protein